MNLNELNRVSKYYQDNPDKIPSYNIKSPARDSEDGNYKKILHSNVKKYNYYINQFKKKWKKVAPNVLFGRNRWSDDSEVYIWDILQPVENTNDPNIHFGDLFKIRDAKNYFDDYYSDKEDALRRAKMDEKDDLRKFLRKHYDEFKKDILNIEKMNDSLKENPNIERKMALQKGIDYNDYTSAMDHIKRYTKMSGRAIPKEIWPVLHKMTVVPGNLPKYVYRGLFYDGDKIKDEKEFKKKWHEGSKPMIKSRKATSWSTSPTTALHFMDAGEDIKNVKDGYHIMLRYEIVDPKMVVADLRVFPDLTFWNQQEILISPEAKDYEVFKIFKKEDTYTDKKLNRKKGDNFKSLDKTYQDRMGGGYGYDKGEIFRYGFFDSSHLNIPEDQKSILKSLADGKVRDVEEKANIYVTGNEEYKDLPYALYYMVQMQNLDCSIDKIHSPTKLSVTYFSYSGGGHSRNEMAKFTISLLRASPNSFLYEISKIKPKHKKGIETLKKEIKRIRKDHKTVDFRIKG